MSTPAGVAAPNVRRTSAGLGLGLGLGLGMQTFALIVQNAVGYANMGIASAATQMSRSIEIALLGTMLFQVLRDPIAQKLPPGAPGLGSGSGQAAEALLDPGQLGQSDADREPIDQKPEDRVVPGHPRLAPPPAAPPKRDPQRG